MCSAAFSRRDVEPVGIGENARIAVGGAEQHRDHLAARNRCAADLDAVLEHPALEQLEWWIPADQLLDRIRCGDFARHEPLPLPAGARSRARTPLPSVFTVASWPAFSSTTTVETISSSESRPPSTRAATSALTMSSRGRAAPLLDQLEHVVAELGGRARRRLRLLLGRVELVHLHVTVRPVEQVAVAIGRHAEQPADQRDRVRLREVVEQIEAAAFEAVVEELGRELLGRLAQRFDGARRERRRDELADPRVLGRLDEEEAPALDVPERLPARVERLGLELALGADVAEVASEALVAQAGAHLCMACDEPAVELLVVADGCLLSERVQRGVRVGDERRIGRIEGDERTLLRRGHGEDAGGRCVRRGVVLPFPGRENENDDVATDERPAREALRGEADPLQLEPALARRVRDQDPILAGRERRHALPASCERWPWPC